MVNKEQLLKKLKNDIANFKENKLNDGWIEEEIDEEIAVFFESFQWYKYNNVKKSLKSYIYKFLVCFLITYLAFNALIENNKVVSSKYNEIMFGYQVHYHIQRYMRFIALPFYKLHDLSKYHDGECLLRNPFYVEELPGCSFCEGVEEVKVVSIENFNVTDYLENDYSQPYVIKNVPGYYNITVNFQSFKDLFSNYSNELNKAICNYNTDDSIGKVSDYFKFTEEEIMQRNISLTWTNCHTYGTRFYRKLFPRPLFVPNTSEIYFEKTVLFLQNGFAYENPDINQDGITYIVQVSGQSNFKMSSPDMCHSNCTSQELLVQLNKGDIFIYSRNEWTSSLVSSSKELSIIYISKFSK
ncbi:uncharacterized protein LOC101241624 isoform X1 [Hydra vulgaris]|uniref:uncharacterized protein LOC101241624 isoform X1 n=1 Tax=Hydra vulgaris TaxID=6087 RepID=UPI001F5EB285|nr:uncharacterized protein LOC101241624 [Hydra vulgaris]